MMMMKRSINNELRRLIDKLHGCILETWEELDHARLLIHFIDTVARQWWDGGALASIVYQDRRHRVWTLRACRFNN